MGEERREGVGGRVGEERREEVCRKYIKYYYSLVLYHSHIASMGTILLST